MPASDDLKRKTFHSVLWTGARVGSANLLSFAMFAVLARLLTPAMFGLFALATISLEFAKVMSTAGLGDAIVQVKQLDDTLAAAAFWANLALAVVVGVAIWSLAHTYAAIVGNPAVAPLMHWLSVLIPVSACGAIHLARKLRGFGHKAVAWRTILCGVLGGGGAIVAARHGWGVWSLMVQITITEVIGAAFAWHVFPWWPRWPGLALIRQRLRPVAGYAAGMVLTQILFLLLLRSPDVLIGAVLGATAVGTYRIAWRIFELIIQSTLFPITTVSIVTLARLQDDRAGFANAYGRMLGLAALVALPTLFGFGVLSKDLLVLLFGPQWQASAMIGTILAGMAPAYLLNFFMGPVLAAAGRARASVLVASVEVLSAVVLGLLTVRFGLITVTLVYAARAYLTMPYLVWVLRRETGVTLRIITQNLGPPLGAALIMVAVLLPLDWLLPYPAVTHLVRAMVGIPLGVAGYALGLALCARGFIRSQYHSLRPLLRRRLTGPMGGPPASPPVQNSDERRPLEPIGKPARVLISARRVVVPSRRARGRLPPSDRRAWIWRARVGRFR